MVTSTPCIVQLRLTPETDMTKSNLIPAALAALLAAGALGTVFTQTANAQATTAGQTDASELALVDGAKVSLADAIATAEKEFGGKAADAGLDDENGSLAYEIELLSPNGEQKISVDAMTGKAMAMAKEADGEDQGDDAAGENKEAGETQETNEGAEGAN